MLRVTDLDRSIKFYTEALGCTLIRTRDNPDNKYKLAFLGMLLHTACILAVSVACFSCVVQLSVHALLYTDVHCEQYHMCVQR